MNNKNTNTRMDDVSVLTIAKKVLEAMPGRSLTPPTEKLYRTTGALYYDHPDRTFETQSKRSYYVRKASLTFYATIKLAEGVAAQSAKTAAHAMRVLAMFMTSNERSEYGIASGRCPLIDPKRRVSKRQSLRGLPLDWRQLLINSATDPQLKAWILVLAATGARPSELARGVQVSPVLGGARIVIRGSKTDRGHGQPVRIFEVIGELAAQLAALELQWIQARTANQVSTAVGRLARKVLGCDRPSLVSAYSFRHQFASDLKGAGTDGDDLSAILGHSVSDTKKHYGAQRQCRAPLGARLVSASRPVKQVGGGPRRAQGLSLGHQL